jgi:hypothetical protein
MEILHLDVEVVNINFIGQLTRLHHAIWVYADLLHVGYSVSTVLYRSIVRKDLSYLRLFDDISSLSYNKTYFNVDNSFIYSL